MFDIYNPTSGCLQQTSHNTKNGKCQEMSATRRCVRIQLKHGKPLSQPGFHPYCFTPFLFFGAKRNGYLTTLITLHICFSVEVTLDPTSICEILCPVESPLWNCYHKCLRRSVVCAHSDNWLALSHVHLHWKCKTAIIWLHSLLRFLSNEPIKESFRTSMSDWEFPWKRKRSHSHIHK